MKRPSMRRSGASRWLLVALTMLSCMTRSLASPHHAAGALLALRANDDAYTVRHDHVLSVPTLGVLANDLNIGGATAVRDSQPAHGTLAFLSNGAFTYTPTPEFVGTDSFIYHAQGLLLPSNQATVTLTITNAAPNVVDDTYAATTGVSLSVPAPGILGNDTDADGDSLTASLVDGSGNGSLAVKANGGFTFKSGGSFSGDRTFTYRVSDGITTSAIATVTIHVSPAATPAPTPSPSPTPVPTPSGGPGATPRPSTPSTPRPSAPATPGPSTAPTPSAGPTRSTAPSALPSPSVAPSASAAPAGGAPTGSSGGPLTGGNLGAGPPIAPGTGSGLSIDVGEPFGPLDGISLTGFLGFDWAVPGLALTVPGLLLLLALAAQAGVGVFSLPVVRRWLGSFGLRRRRNDDAEAGWPGSQTAPGTNPDPRRPA